LPKLLPELIDDRAKIRPLAVQMVDDDDVRYAFLLSSPPDALGDHLDRILRVYHQHRAIRHPLGHERIPYEPPVSGSVEDIDLAPLPFEIGDAHPERHAALDFLLRVVHHVTHGSTSPGSKPQHALRQRSFATPPVADHTYIAN